MMIPLLKIFYFQASELVIVIVIGMISGGGMELRMLNSVPGLSLKTEEARHVYRCFA